MNSYIFDKYVYFCILVRNFPRHNFCQLEKIISIQKDFTKSDIFCWRTVIPEYNWLNQRDTRAAQWATDDESAFNRRKDPLRVPDNVQTIIYGGPFYTSTTYGWKTKLEWPPNKEESGFRQSSSPKTTLEISI